MVQKENSRQIWNEHLTNKTTESTTSSESNISDTISQDSSCSNITPRKQTARKTLKNILPEQENVIRNASIDPETAEIQRMLLHIDTEIDEDDLDKHPFDEYFTEEGTLKDRDEVRSPSYESNSRSHPENTQSGHTSSENSDAEHSSPEESTNEVPYTIDGDYYNLAGHTKIHRLSYDAAICRPLIQRKKVLRELTKFLFNERQLARRSLKIENVSKKISEEFKVKAIEPEKLEYLQRLYREYIKNKGIPDDLFKKRYWPEARETLRYHIRDVREKIRSKKQAKANKHQK